MPEVLVMEKIPEEIPDDLAKHLADGYCPLCQYDGLWTHKIDEVKELWRDLAREMNERLRD